MSDDLRSRLEFFDNLEHIGRTKHLQETLDKIGEGDQVLVVSKKEEPSLMYMLGDEEERGCGVAPRMPMTSTIYEVRFGQLSGKPNMGEGRSILKWGLPCERHASSSSGDGLGYNDIDYWENNPGEITFSLDDVHWGLRPGSDALQVYSGDEVPLYFSFDDAMRKIFFDSYFDGKLDLNELVKRSENSGKINTVYLDILRGLDLDIPEGFRERFYIARKEEKMQLLNEVRSYEKDSGVTTLLKKARKWGMMDSDDSVRIRPGIVMDVREYLLDLEEKYLSA